MSGLLRLADNLHQPIRCHGEGIFLSGVMAGRPKRHAVPALTIWKESGSTGRLCVPKKLEPTRPKVEVNLCRLVFTC